MPVTKFRKKAQSKPVRHDETRGLRSATTVSRWGNSLGLRIPRHAAERLHLKAGQQVRIELRGRSITITPTTQRRKWTEAQLLQGVTPAMVGGEIDFGHPVGKEVW